MDIITYITVFIVILFFTIIVYLPLMHSAWVLDSLERMRAEKYKANIPCIINYPLSVAERSAILPRVLSMHYTLLSYTWIICFVVAAGMSQEETVPSFMRWLTAFRAFLPLTILFLWWETFNSLEYQCLSHQMEEKNCKEYIQELRGQWPVLTLTVVASHEEEGKVIDGIEHVKFPYTYWVDESSSSYTLILDPNKVTRVKLQKRVILGDRKTLSKYYRLQDEMKVKIRRLNTDSSIEFEVNPGDEERFCVFRGIDGKRWWTNKWLYIIMSLFLMTWVYRIAFRYATQAKSFRVVKRIYYTEEIQTTVDLK